MTFVPPAPTTHDDDRWPAARMARISTFQAIRHFVRVFCLQEQSAVQQVTDAGRQTSSDESKSFRYTRIITADGARERDTILQTLHKLSRTKQSSVEQHIRVLSVSRKCLKSDTLRRNNNNRVRLLIRARARYPIVKRRFGLISNQKGQHHRVSRREPNGRLKVRSMDRRCENR